MVPGVPIIRKHPIVSANKLEFYWDDPQSNEISSYILLCKTLPYSTILSKNTHYAVVSTLTNQTPYTFELAAINAVGTGDYVSFTTVQPGNPPAGPTNVQVSTVNLSTALVTWNFSTLANESNLEWFKIQMIPASNNTPNINYTVYPNESSVTITNILSFTNYSFHVQAINAAGYDSADAITSSILLGVPFMPTAITTICPTVIDHSTVSIIWSGGLYAQSHTFKLNSINVIPVTSYEKTATFTNLSSNTSYTVEVIANNNIGHVTSLYTPNAISSLQLWLDGADPLASEIVPFNGTEIHTWYDKSGKHNHATGINSPTYSPIGITFNGINQYFTTEYSPQSTSETVFIVYNLISNTQATLVTSGSRNFQSLPAPNGPSLPMKLTGSLSIVTGTNYLAECSSSPTGINIYVDGSTSASNTNNPEFTAGNTLIGAGYNPNMQLEYCLNGYISEILIYNSQLDLADRQKVEGYLAWKWSIQSKLPTNHPYFSVRPGGVNFTTSKFKPTNIPSVKIWLDGQDPLATGMAQASETVISIWYDKSGYSYHAIGTGSPTMNSTNSITLNGSTQYYTIPYIGAHQDETMFVVMNLVSTSGEHNIICGKSQSTRQFTIYKDLLNIYSYQIGGLITSTTVPHTGTQVILMYTLSSTNISIFNNASLLTSAAGFTPEIEYGINIGVNGLGKSGYLNGTISEVLIYNSVLTLQDRQKVEGYLAWKWSIQTKLPNNHPYFFDSP